MASKRSPEDLSVDELRRLLIEKKRFERQERLTAFQKSGRIILPAPQEGRREDWEDNRETGRLGTNRPQRRRRGLDKFLFVLEIAATIGLLVILFNGYSLVRNLNQEFAATFRQPVQETPSPVPSPPSLVLPVVIPSGHTPPKNGESQPNIQEVPEQLRPTVESLPTQPVPTHGPEQAVRIVIPAINVDAPVVQGDSWEQLKKGVAQHIGSADPGQIGNMVLSGHDDVYGEVFRDLPLLKVGDSIIVYTESHQFVYIIDGSQIVSPTQVEVMDPTETPTVTLISCYPYLIDTQRIVVTGKLQDNSQ